MTKRPRPRHLIVRPSEYVEAVVTLDHGATQLTQAPVYRHTQPRRAQHRQSVAISQSGARHAGVNEPRVDEGEKPSSSLALYDHARHTYAASQTIDVLACGVGAPRTMRDEV